MAADSTLDTLLEDGSIPCTPAITEAGLPHREAAILQRERHLYPLQINRLLGQGKGHFQSQAVTLTLGMVATAFRQRDATTLPAAGFLAGRCQPALEHHQQLLTTLLQETLTSFAVDNLRTLAPAYIEIAMSLALRGQLAAGQAALRPLVTTPDCITPHSYLAAFYLAQCGDPVGYPTLLKTLEDRNEHYRLMAVRHAIGFLPYEGQSVGDQVVDLAPIFAARLQDKSAMVRAELPYLMAEARVEGLPSLLQPVAKQDSDPNVRRAAQQVLADLDDSA